MQLQKTLIRNRIISSLPDNELDRILPCLTVIQLEERKQLYAAEQPIDYIYFVETGMISLVYTFESGWQAEVGLISRDGLLGAFVTSRVTLSFFDAMVQMSGSALRMTIRDFQSKADTCTQLRTALLQYNEMLQAQAMQSAACNSHHGLEQRLARWLLMARDQTETTELPLTQDFLSMMLGVHRPSVTVIAGSLQRYGLIEYKAGHIRILSQSGLEAVACECYRANRRRYDLMWPQSRVRS